MNSPTWELRRRGAEACSWISEQAAFDALFSDFATDPEPSVRDAVRRAFDERWERSYASRCLAAVLAVDDGSNEQILSAWRFGRALTQLPQFGQNFTDFQVLFRRNSLFVGPTSFQTPM
jgi:hypothetical protein